jgi:hypothetical protein
MGLATLRSPALRNIFVIEISLFIGSFLKLDYCTSIQANGFSIKVLITESNACREKARNMKNNELSEVIERIHTLEEKLKSVT